MTGDRTDLGVIIDCLSRVLEARDGKRLMTQLEGAELLEKAYDAALRLQAKESH